MTPDLIKKVEGLESALKLCLNVLDQITDPSRFGSSAGIVYCQAVEAASVARRSLEARDKGDG